MGTITTVRSQRPAVHSSRLPRQERIAVGLLEDHQLLRERLTEFLNKQPGLQVVLSAAATPGGLERLQEARPRVVVIGSADNGTVCHDRLRAVTHGLPEARVVVMNVSGTREDVILLIEEGANGLLLQEATLDEVVRTIRRVSGGTNVIPDPLVPVLFAHLAEQGPGRPAAGGRGRLDRLTPREREVSALIADGLTNQEVADCLAISLHTVKTHVHNILAKLDLQSRLQIVVYVRKHGG